MMRRKKNIARMVLLTFMLSVVLPVGGLFAATTASDIQGHWAEIVAKASAFNPVGSAESNKVTFTIQAVKSTTIDGVKVTSRWSDENTIKIDVNGGVTYANNTMPVEPGGLGNAFYNAQDPGASMLDAQGKPLANRNNGQFTALSVNLTDVMTGLGIAGETVITKIVQTNPALEMYDKIDPNVSNSTGSWVKDKTYQDVTVSNVGNFSFLLLNGDTTATIVISYGTDKTLTIDVKSKLTITSPMATINTYRTNQVAPRPTIADYQAIVSEAVEANLALYNAKVVAGATHYTIETLTTLVKEVNSREEA